MATAYLLASRPKTGIYYGIYSRGGGVLYDAGASLVSSTTRSGSQTVTCPEAAHRLHPCANIRFVPYYAMASRADAYFPVQRIAQACLQCRYAIVALCAHSRFGRRELIWEGERNAGALAIDLFVDNANELILVSEARNVNLARLGYNGRRLRISRRSFSAAGPWATKTSSSG